MSETPQPVLYDVLRHGHPSFGERVAPDPFPMGSAGRPHSARYLFADGSYIEVRPVEGGIEVRCVQDNDHGSMVVRPRDSSMVTILLPVEPWDGSGMLDIPGGTRPL